jgi:hypothetical protein
MPDDREKRFLNDRNIWLSSSDEEFAKYCTIENFQDSGKGGQKRNRKYSAVRLKHIQSALSAECVLYREQNMNRIEAARKLRIKLGLELSGPVIENIRSTVSTGSNDYPLWVAYIMDELYRNSFDLEPLAEKLSLSKSKLIKLIYRDRELWNEVNRQRARLGKYIFSL